MSKRRVKNNFKKWMMKSLPFFLVVLFIFFNVAFFIYNASEYRKKTAQTVSGSLKKISEEFSFRYVLSIPQRDSLKEKLDLYRIEKDGYPFKLQDLPDAVKNKNWMYTRSADRYILEYRH